MSSAHHVQVVLMEKNMLEIMHMLLYDGKVEEVQHGKTVRPPFDMFLRVAIPSACVTPSHQGTRTRTLHLCANLGMYSFRCDIRRCLLVGHKIV